MGKSAYILELQNTIQERDVYIAELTEKLAAAEEKITSFEYSEQRIAYQDRLIEEYETQFEQLQEKYHAIMEQFEKTQAHIEESSTEHEGWNVPQGNIPYTTLTPTARGKEKCTYDVDEEVFLVENDREGPSIVRQEGRLKKPLKFLKKKLSLKKE